MPNLSLKVAYSIIIAGLFVAVALFAMFYQVLDWSFYIIIVPLIVFLFLFGFAAGQRFSFPVKKLIKEADYLRQGNLKSRFYPEGGDEFGQLAETLNKIAEEFKDNKIKIDALDGKVKLRTRALEEIISVLEQKVKNRTMEFQRVVEELERAESDLKLKNDEISDLKSRLEKKPKTKKIKGK